MSTREISAALSALEALSSSPSTSSSGPLNALLETHFAQARERITNGDDPKTVIQDLQKNIVRAKKEVEKGLKGWYAALGNVGKVVDKNFPANLAGISDAYADPPLFSEGEAPDALDKVVLASIGRQGLWEAVNAFEEETGLQYDPEKRKASEDLSLITRAITAGNVEPALQWCRDNAEFLSRPPHPSPLPYYLHRSVVLRMKDPSEAVRYARTHLMSYVPFQPVLQLLTSCLYPAREEEDDETMHMNGSNGVDRTGNGALNGHDGMDIDGEESDFGKLKSPYTHAPAPLVSLFRAEFCRRHEWPKEEPLEVVVDLGSRGGALNAIEKARKVMGERLGSVRQWTDLPMEIPLPTSRRYHSVFVCPVSKEQATEANPPKMLACGHVLASESFTKIMKGTRRSAKCPYCPVETSSQAAQRLYF